MSDEERMLDDSHDWGETHYMGSYIPCCRDCRVNGFEDEPRAFLPCTGQKKPRTRCPATMWSLDDLGHQHVCIGGHTGRDHLCVDCQRWFFKAGE